jgi:uncharacterized membrane protein YgcG
VATPQGPPTPLAESVPTPTPVVVTPLASSTVTATPAATAAAAAATATLSSAPPSLEYEGIKGRRCFFINEASKNLDARAAEISVKKTAALRKAVREAEREAYSKAEQAGMERLKRQEEAQAREVEARLREAAEREERRKDFVGKARKFESGGGGGGANGGGGGGDSGGGEGGDESTTRPAWR